jgi:hypothetical protein
MLFDIDNMIHTSNVFSKKLKGLTDLGNLQIKGYKLGIANEETYISWWYFQGLQRAYNAESIEKVLLFLNEQFSDFKIFMLMLETAIRYNKNLDEISLLIELQRENTENINNWKKGLLYLHAEYDESIQKQLDLIIQDLFT